MTHHIVEGYYHMGESQFGATLTSKIGVGGSWYVLGVWNAWRTWLSWRQVFGQEYELKDSVERRTLVYSKSTILNHGALVKRAGPIVFRWKVVHVHVPNLDCFFLLFSGSPQAYVEFITEMGGVWLERHLFAIFHHILELVASPKTTSTHIDSVYARKCVSFILNTCVSRLLGESAQLLATKHLCKLVTQAATATLPSAATAPGTCTV